MDTRNPLPENPGPLLKRLYVDEKRSLKNIMQQYQVSQRRLQGYLRAEGVAFRPPGRPRVGPRADLRPATPRMVERYHSMSLNKASKRAHVPPLVMLKRLQLADVRLRPEDLARATKCVYYRRAPLPSNPDELLRRLYLTERHSICWIMEHYDVQYNRVRRILRRLDIKIRPEG
jgi:hypothetical protein